MNYFNLNGQIDWSIDRYYYEMKNKKGENIVTKEHLDEIANKYNNYFSLININRESKMDNGLRFFQHLLSDKIKDCEEMEKQIANELGIAIQYNEVKGSKADVNQRKIQFWTNYFFYNIPSAEKINLSERLSDFSPEFCLKLIMSSKEFALKIRSQSGFRELSRTKFAKAIGGETLSMADVEKELIAEIKDSNSTIYNDVFNAFSNTFNNYGGWTDKNSEDFIENVKEKLELLKTESFKSIKTIFRNCIESTFTKLALERGLNDTSMSISREDSDVDYITVSVLQRGVMGQLKEGNQFKDIKELVYQAIIQTIEVLSARGADRGEFNLMWLNAEKIQIVKKQIDKFYNKALSGTSRKILKDMISITLEGKSSLDEVSGITGLIGEITGLLNFKSISDIQHTGTKIDVLESLFGKKNISLGESYADLFSSTSNNGVGVGVNIKHYVSTGGTLTLYEPKNKEGYLIIGDDLAKFIPEQQLALIRFLEVNYAYVKTYCDKLNSDISRETLGEGYINVGLVNLDNFLRQTTTIDKSSVGFYQLNNLIIPSSQIYQLIYDNIEKYENFLFTVNATEANIIPFVSRKRAPNPEQFLMSNLSSALSKKTVGARLTFNGLKINLKDLKL